MFGLALKETDFNLHCLCTFIKSFWTDFIFSLPVMPQHCSFALALPSAHKLDTSF